MVNLPPPSDPNDRQPPRYLRDTDEAIAIGIAFLAVGAILWWGWTRGRQFVAPLVGDTSFLEESFMSDEPMLDLGLGDTEAEDLDLTVLPFGNDASMNRDERDDDRSAATGDRGLGALAQEREARDGSVVAPAAVAPTTTADTDAEASTETPLTETDAPATAETPIDETATPPPLDISDVSEDYWAYPYIADLFEKGLLPDFPSGQLRPDSQLTRAEFAAFLNSSFVQAEGEGQLSEFSDVSGDFWAAEAIQNVVGAGYMSGYPDDTFKPDAIMPRYEVLIALVSGLDLPDSSNPQDILSRFQQAGELPDWSRAKVATAAENQILVNHPEPSNLAPQRPATRAEVIVMIHQALLNQGRVDEINSPFVNP